MRIEELAKGVLESCPHKMLIPAHSKVKISVNGVLDGLKGQEGTYPNGSERKTTLGRFYEGVMRGFYGGRLTDTKYSFELNGEVRPDVIVDDEDLYLDAKGNVSGGHADIRESQFRKYQHSQFLFPERTYKYAIYRHVLRGIEKIPRYDDEIIESLVSKTVSSVVLPLSVLVGVAQSRNTHLAYFYSNEETKWGDHICLKSPTTNRLLTEPVKVLEEIGLNPRDYRIERYFSPSGFKVNGMKIGFSFDGGISPFPIVHIVERNHNRWVKNFRIQYEEKMMEEQKNPELEVLPLIEEAMERVGMMEEAMVVPKESDVIIPASRKTDDDLF